MKNTTVNISQRKMTDENKTEEKNKGGRPQKLTPEQLQKIVDDFKAYILKEEDPTIVGFTCEYPILIDIYKEEFYLNKDYISDHDEFSELRKRAIQKQENYMQKGAVKNELNSSMSIFRLKQPQHGFTDKSELKQENIGEPTRIFINTKPKDDK